jgi:hypothetical protein
MPSAKARVATLEVINLTFLQSSAHSFHNKTATRLSVSLGRNRVVFDDFPKPFPEDSSVICHRLKKDSQSPDNKSSDCFLIYVSQRSGRDLRNSDFKIRKPLLAIISQSQAASIEDNALTV